MCLPLYKRFVSGAPGSFAAFSSSHWFWNCSWFTLLVVFQLFPPDFGLFSSIFSAFRLRFRRECRLIMPPICSTNDSLAAGVVSSPRVSRCGKYVLLFYFIFIGIFRCGSCGSGDWKFAAHDLVFYPGERHQFAGFKILRFDSGGKRGFSIAVQPDFSGFLVYFKLGGIGGGYGVFARYVYFAAIYFYLYHSICHCWRELDPPRGFGFFPFFLCFPGSLPALGPKHRSPSLRSPLRLPLVISQSRESWLQRFLMVSSWSWRTCCR